MWDQQALKMTDAMITFLDVRVSFNMKDSREHIRDKW